MRVVKLILAASALCLLAACGGVEIRAWEPTEFAKGNYSYYKWRSEPLTNTVGSRDVIYRLDPALRASVDQILTKKGYVLDYRRAQFSIDYAFATGLRQGAFSPQAGGGGIYGGVYGRRTDQASRDNAIALGTAINETRNIGLQINDVASRREIWRVIMTKVTGEQNLSQEQLRKNIDGAVSKALAKLPNA